MLQYELRAVAIGVTMFRSIAQPPQIQAAPHMFLFADMLPMLVRACQASN